MARAAEAHRDPLVPHAFTLQSLANARCVHEIDRALLQDTRANPFDHVFFTPILDNDRVDSREVKEMAEHQAGRPCANNSDLGPNERHE